MNDWVAVLPHLNASLNGLATVLLVSAFVAIKQRREVLHRSLMLTALAVSAAFLVSYLLRLWLAGNKPFPTGDYPVWISAAYFVVLISHVSLAISVPVLALWAVTLGLRNQRQRHRQVARWAFPIWLYVSLTGVLVYFMLYWWFPPRI